MLSENECDKNNLVQTAQRIAPVLKGKPSPGIAGPSAHALGQEHCGAGGSSGLLLLQVGL